MENRPKILEGVTYRKKTGCGYMYVILNAENGKLVEVFTSMGKAGGCAAAQAEALCRILSKALKYGMPPEDCVNELIGIQCHAALSPGDDSSLSCADAIGQAFRDHVASKKIAVREIKIAA